VAAVYIDTSAIGRVLLGEPDAVAVRQALGDFEQHVASRLMRTELRRLALREGLLEDAEQLLAGVALIPVDDAVLTLAGTVTPATVATLDAIHLATALKLAGAGILNTVMTYDPRLASAVELHGLRVAAP
jgi:uncharacterized protein